MQVKKIVLTLALLSALSARADGFKMRAREHYETVNLHLDQHTPNTTYGGFSNTINLWYEKPLTYAFGIAASPLGATLPRQGAAVDPTLGDRIRLVHIGLEAKAFPLYESSLNMSIQVLTPGS